MENNVSFLDIIREQQAKARATGKVMRRTFNKEKFLREFPQAANDPRFALLPDNFKLDMSPLEPISVKELRQLCEAKPNSPLAISKRASILGLSDEQVVSVLIEDLDILRAGEAPSTIVLPKKAPQQESSPPPPKKKKPTTLPKEGIFPSKDADDKTS